MNSGGRTYARTVLYCTVLYCTALYCTVLYCTVLYLGEENGQQNQANLGNVEQEIVAENELSVTPPTLGKLVRHRHRPHKRKPLNEDRHREDAHRVVKLVLAHQSAAEVQGEQTKQALHHEAGDEELQEADFVRGKVLRGSRVQGLGSGCGFQG